MARIRLTPCDGETFMTTNQSVREIVESRAVAYDTHYSTGTWESHHWTKESIESRLAYALDVPSGGSLNGNEIQCALQAIGAPDLAGKTILDYCCGTGITAIYFALCGAKVHAFDASSAAIEIAKESAKRSDVESVVDFTTEDARELPYASDTFDFVFCQSALHIVIDYPECPAEIARVLKSGGKAVFCEEALDQNIFLRPIRRLRRRRHRECGGRPLRYADIRAFGHNFSLTTIHHFNLLGQIKNLFAGHRAKHGRMKPGVRLLLRTLEKTDRCILAVVPWLKRFCGKVTVEYAK